ncbi:MAG: ABC transporter permease subunit [Variovorax sp.]
MAPRLRSRRAFLAFALQVLLVVVLLSGAVWLVTHALDVLRARGVRSGFDFLWQPAGFGIGEGWLDFDSDQPFWRAFLAGLINTIRAAVPAAVLAVVLGTLIGIGRLAPHVLVRAGCTAYVEAVRNVPLLVQLLMLYFALTQLLRIRPTRCSWCLASGSARTAFRCRGRCGRKAHSGRRASSFPSVEAST